MKSTKSDTQNEQFLQKQLREAEALARHHLPRAEKRRPVPFKKQRITITRANGRRDTAFAFGRKTPFDPGEVASWYSPEQLFSMWRLDLESLLKAMWKQGLRADQAAYVHNHTIATLLLALCRYAREHTLSQRQSFIAGHNIAIARMALRRPEVIRFLNSERAKRAKDIQDAKNKLAKDFACLVARKLWKEDRTEPPLHIARYIEKHMEPRKLGLKDKPKATKIKGWIKHLAPGVARKAGRPRKTK